MVILPLVYALLAGEPPIATTPADAPETQTRPRWLLAGQPPIATPPADAPETQTQPRRLAVGVDDRAQVSATLVDQALRAHLADLAIAPAVEARPTATLADHLEWAREHLATGADAVVWVEPAAVDGHLLYLLLGAPERLYVRHVDTPDDPLETREILGVIIRGLVASLAASEAPADMEVVAVPVAAPPAPPPAPLEPTAEPPPSPPEPRFRLLLGLGYAGSTYAARLPWASGLSFEIGALGRRGLVLAFGGAGLLHPAFTPTLGQQTRDDARLWLGRVGFTARVGVRIPLGARRRVFVEPALVGRGEVFMWRPRANSRAQSGAGVRAGLAPTLTLGLALGRGVALTLAAGLDLWLRNLDLVARTPVGTTPIVRPPVVGATAGLGVVWVRG